MKSLLILAFGLCCLKQKPVAAADACIIYPVNSPAFFVSDWGKIDSWEKSVGEGKNTFKGGVQYLNPVNKDYTVLVFVRNYNFTNIPMGPKPLALPFVFFGDDGGTGCYNWDATFTHGGFTISTCMPPALEGSYLPKQAAIEYRYFQFSPQFLAAKNVTAAGLKGMRYADVAALAGVPH